MKQLLTHGIILSRTDYGEADRIITLLTPDHGKLRLMAKGVRKVKSKLAGGIELFSVSHITFIQGRGEVGTLISTRLEKHYGHIVKSIDRVQLGYELIKQLDKATEDEPEADYFDLLQRTFEALDEKDISLDLIRTWFQCNLLKLAGHEPNLRTDVNGRPLQADKQYEFSYDDMAFFERPDGAFGSDHIKFLRLIFNGNQPKILQQIRGIEHMLEASVPLVRTVSLTYLRI